MAWKVVLAKQALRDKEKLNRSPLRPKAEELLNLLREDPFRQPPPCKRLIGDLAGAWSRRINIQHRLVYEVDEESHTVKVLYMWSHYGD